MPPYHSDIALEDMIANYGDSSSTNWTDAKFQIWRHKTGAAIGYVPSGSHYVVLGSPLCEHDRRIETEVLLDFHTWCKSKKKSPLFLCVGPLTQSILSDDLGYRSIQAAIEEVVADPSSWDVKHNGDKEMRRHVRKAEEEIEVRIIEGEPDDQTRKEIEEGLEAWQAARTGAQIHTSELKPWRDPEHRRFVYGRKRDNGKICGLVVLTEIEEAFYIKWALQFPDAPSGCSELLIAKAIESIKSDNVKELTFGPGAADQIAAAAHFNGIKIWTLEHIYSALNKMFKLSNKTDFRRKFGIEERPLYVCYPKGKLGVKGLESILGILEGDKKVPLKRS